MIFEKQGYQQECIDNIINLLENFDFKNPNAEMLKNCFESSPPKVPFQNLNNGLNVDILMETGTGKTFTYLNLIFELNKKYKQNKFIIFVPRKAILESIKQNIALTTSYFYNEYKKHLKTYIYADSKSPNEIVNHYIKNTDELGVLVLTNSAIDKKDNILNKNSENLFDTKSIFENIAALKPISIIDEPHLLKGDAFNKYFSKIDSLYFRFGATFPKAPPTPRKSKNTKDSAEFMESKISTDSKNALDSTDSKTATDSVQLSTDAPSTIATPKSFELSNVAYCLDSINAFSNYLVKQISVHTISKIGEKPYLDSTNSKGKGAKFIYFSDNVKQEATIKVGESVGILGSEYSGFSLTSLKNQIAYLSDESGNFATIEKRESYVLSESEITHMLSKAIDLHFEKEERLFKQNIKALSLFFIPSIESFRGEKNRTENGVIDSHNIAQIAQNGGGGIPSPRLSRDL